MADCQQRIVIPARYASSRLPGKPLLEIGDKPMIQHVYERALEADLNSVCIATDDQRILDAATAFGADAVMTRDDHVSGTDRIAEVSETMGWADEDIVVNVQGDEPDIPAALIRQVADALAENPDAAMSTACCPIQNKEQFFDPNVVKVVRDNRDMALYFSRAPIPWDRDRYAPATSYATSEIEFQPSIQRRHVGIYAYRVSTLKTLTATPPHPLEQSESLEQLRALGLGLKIHCPDACALPGLGVDTEADLTAARERLRA